MKYNDRVYGAFEINEPVILELISCPSLQRLKDIDQAGYRPLWVKPAMKVGRHDHSRFAHSLGVYLLLRKYGAPLPEQLAGLIHDVSHSAFSHCIDYVLADGSEKEHSHQDNLFNRFIRKTEIPEIIEKHGFDSNYILDDKNFPLKEKTLPDLCADRIDYSLRTAVIFAESIKSGISYFLENLTAASGSWIFKNFESANSYAQLFLRLNTNYYSSFPAAVMFRTVGDYLRHALNRGYLSEADLYTTDKAVLVKLKKYLPRDKQLNFLFRRMNKKIGCTNNPQSYDAVVFIKSRVVDPLCWRENTLRRVSEIDPNWEKMVKRESQPKQYFLKFEK